MENFSEIVREMELAFEIALSVILPANALKGLFKVMIASSEIIAIFQYQK
jgi:hypothetical protein